MKGLPNLIRLHHWRLDEKRKQVAELRRLAAELWGQRHRLEEELRTEQDVARSSTEAGTTYGGYAKSVIERRRNLEVSIRDVEAQIERATMAVTEAFREVKHYELALAEREKKAGEKMARRERAVLDEIGAQSYCRR